MNEINSNLPQDLEQYLYNQKKDLLSLKEAFTINNNLDQICSKAFQSFVEHRIDDILKSISDHFHNTADRHHLTPNEIDFILHNILKDLHQVASLDFAEIDTEEAKPKRIILNWLKQNLLTAYKVKQPKSKILGELLRMYVVSDHLEKESIYDRIKLYLISS